MKTKTRVKHLQTGQLGTVVEVVSKEIAKVLWASGSGKQGATTAEWTHNLKEDK